MKTPEQKRKHADYMREYYWKNKERWLARMKVWKEKNRERHLENKRRFAAKNREKINAKFKEDYAANPEKYKERQRKLYKEKPEMMKALSIKGYAKNKEKIKARSKVYYEKVKNNPEYKKTRYESCSKWQKLNHAKVIKYSNDRRGRELSATPQWANHLTMECHYEFAALKSKITGKRYEVDHIVPLSSKFVCGLHTDYNMQVIERFSNRSKGNRSWPDMP